MTKATYLEKITLLDIMEHSDIMLETLNELKITTNEALAKAVENNLLIDEEYFKISFYNSSMRDSSQYMLHSLKLTYSLKPTGINILEGSVTAKPRRGAPVKLGEVQFSCATPIWGYEPTTTPIYRDNFIMVKQINSRHFPDILEEFRRLRDFRQ